MSGVLTIHSNGDGQLLSGHSWIEYTPDGGAPTTYGTWGNNPGGLGNGLHENLELGRPSDASRSMHIDDAQEAKLFAKIKEYQDEGDKGWGYLNPCSRFATDAWEAGTGESLSHRSGIISNPSKLKASILAANASTKTPPGPKLQSSGRQSMTLPIKSCGP